MSNIHIKPKRLPTARLSALGKEHRARWDWYAQAAKWRAERHKMYEERMGTLPDSVVNVWRTWR